MSRTLATMVVTMPRAGQPDMDLAAALKVPGVVAAVHVGDGRGVVPGGRALPAGQIVAALAAVDDAALRRGLGALALHVRPVHPVTEPVMPDLPLTLRAARGASDPLVDLCVHATPEDAADGALLQRLAADLAKAAGAPLCLMLTAAEALAALPQRPAVAVGARLDLGPDRRLTGLQMALRRQAAPGATAIGPRLALDLPLALAVDLVETDLPAAWAGTADATAPAAIALLELAMQDHAIAEGLDPLALRLATLPPLAQVPLRALQSGWTGPFAGRPADPQARLRQGAGLAAGADAAIHVELLVDSDTGHVLMPVCRVAMAAPPVDIAAAVARGHGLALTEEVAIDPETGAVLAEGFVDLRLAGSFTLPDIETVPCAPSEGAGPTCAEIAALTAAAILTALRDALGQRPCHMPMTPDRALALVHSAGEGRMTELP